MRYYTIGQADSVMWMTENGSGSGVLHAGDEVPVVEGAPVWADYEAWCAAGNTPSPRPDGGRAPTLREVRGAATARLHAAVEDALAPILSAYPSSEVASWPVQWAEATEWLLDNAAPTPMIDSLLGADDKVVLCHRIIEKAEAYSQASGAVFAWRRTVSAWIETCESTDVLAAYVPQFPVLPTASE